jgi:hypothetical protein
MKPHTFTRTLVFILFACIIATLSSCSKNKDESLAVTKDNLAGTYTLSSIKGKVPGRAEEDFTTIYYPENCQRDDEFVLFANMDFDYVDAGSTCNFGGSYSDTWTLDGNEVYFDEIFGTVTKLTSKELVLKYTDGDSYITFYLERKL